MRSARRALAVHVGGRAAGAIHVAGCIRRAPTCRPTLRDRLHPVDQRGDCYVPNRWRPGFARMATRAQNSHRKNRSSSVRSTTNISLCRQAAHCGARRRCRRRSVRGSPRVARSGLRGGSGSMGSVPFTGQLCEPRGTDDNTAPLPRQQESDPPPEAARGCAETRRWAWSSSW